MTELLVTIASAPAATGFPWKDVAPLASAAVAIAAIVFSFFATSRTLKAAKENADAAAWQKANEAEVKFIQERLDGFYGPFRAMSEVNKLMNRDLRGRQGDASTFILIEKLFDKAWRDSLPAGEKSMLSEIADNAKRLRTLIETKTGLVDEQVLPYLARVSAHYRMLELAYEGKLGDDPKPFVARYVFPRSVEDVMRLEVERLQARRDALKLKPFSALPAMPPLSIPAEYALPAWPEPKREPRPELTAPVNP